MFDTLGVAINSLRTRIDNTLLEDQQRRWMSDSQNSLREFYKTDGIPMPASLSKNLKELKELKEELTIEVQEMLNIFESMEQKVDRKSSTKNLLITISELKNKLKTVDKGKNVNTKFNKSEASGTLLCVTPFPKNIAIKAKKVSNSKVNADRSKPVTSHPTPTNNQGQTQNENVLVRGMYRITKTKTLTPDSKTNINVSNSTGVECPNSVRRQKSKDTKSKNRVLKNTNAKISTAHVQKMSRTVSIDSNKCETTNSTLCHVNKSALNTKNVTAVNDGSNIVCVSCGKDVFVLSHEKCVAHYALSRNSNVERALFTTPVIQPVLWIVDSRCSKHMTSNLQLLRNFIEKFMRTIHFRNDHFAAITGYGDYVQGNLMICHNLEGDDLLTGSCDSNLYTISISEMAASSPVSCEQGKSKKASFPPKLVPRTESKLELLHMDLCGPMRVTSINGKKYILVIADDYSRYTWVYFLRTKDEAPDMIIDFVNQVQRNLKAQILTIRTDNGTEFKNEKLQAFYVNLGIVHQTSIARTPQQNGFVERRNRILVEVARTMLIFSKALEYLWAEAIATACFTQNRSIDPSNMHEFYQKHHSSDRWTKNHPIEQVTGDPSKHVMTRNQLQTDAEVCMYALTVSTIEMKNIKEAMLDASWNESMQDELNQFKRLDVWELIECPIVSIKNDHSSIVYLMNHPMNK
ncbi:retrovirus-related pol polyprotein from transposon TNT 1-94 [Tanacetum coccineum]|uniref:Retrovirus-related pol polyprotein from transposon TNT 1-94 n=1 Tax=Tanacetum coccineum TaxID=301880 RepID=A0ABQ4ZF00_9ASTR